MEVFIETVLAALGEENYVFIEIHLDAYIELPWRLTCRQCLPLSRDCNYKNLEIY